LLDLWERDLARNQCQELVLLKKDFVGNTNYALFQTSLEKGFETRKKLGHYFRPP